MASISPYKIAVPQSKLDILKKKLDLATFPDELDGSEWDYGSPLTDIKRLTAYWQSGYDWRKAEAMLNEYPQFTADIPVDGYETFKIHFIYQKSEVKNAIPLIFVHGWPGSFDEVTKILPELVKGGKNQPAFHVVAPSLVNFGFSEGTKKVCVCLDLGSPY
jgi:pimeloyl-ACP methyl ester carboxylesterase